MARLAYDSRAFWETHCTVASPSILARHYPKTAGGLTRPGWQGAIDRARLAFPDLAWNIGERGYHYPEPEVWPEPVYEDGTIVVVQHTEAEPLTTAEKVERDREVRRLKESNSDLKRRLDSAYTDGEIEERICAHIDRCIPALEPVPFPTFTHKSGNTPESAVALFSDYHIGEVVDFEETGGLNAYNREIFMSRLAYHAKSIRSICLDKLTGYDFSELVIIGIGDMVSGIIHDELVETSDGTLMDWLIEGSQELAGAFRMLAASFPEVRIEWHFGNHGRTSVKPRFKKRWVNYDYLLGHMIATELRDQPNITFVNHKSFWSLVEVQDHKILALHGDNIKGWNGLPSYGINRAVANLTALLNKAGKTFDIAVLGHFHQTGLIERMDCDIVLNGSAIGANEFSIGALFAGAQPRQVMFGVHPERGKTWLYSIDLAEADKGE